MNTTVTDISLENQPSANRIKEFRSLLKRSILLTRSEVALLDTIPDVLLARIFKKNFNDNMAFAERVLFNKYDEIDAKDRPALESKKQAIHNLDVATAKMRSYLEQGKKVLFLTDNDNDGSMAQAVILEYIEALPEEVRSNIRTSYAQPIGTARGLNKENIDVLFDHYGWNNRDVLIVTADIGINNREEQYRIKEAYPKAEIIVTDHHLPVSEYVIDETDGTIIFNPQYNPTEFFKRKNISGANTISVLLKNILQQWKNEGHAYRAQAFDQTVSNMNELSSWSNLLDYVEADVADMPLRPLSNEKALKLRTQMNVSNSMGPLVTLSWTDADWKKFAEDVPSVDAEKQKERVARVKKLNLVAKKLLSFVNEFSPKTTFDQKTFYDMLSETMSNPDTQFEGPNPNYIAQLRPFIFRFSAIDNKFAFLENIKDRMIQVYEELGSIEKEIIRDLRSADLLARVKTEHATIVYPKHPALTRLFSRKLLSKIYNEENNGFYAILDGVTAQEYSGSLRSIYPMSDVLPEVDLVDIENRLNVDIDILGHAKAAGLKVKARKGHAVTPEIIAELNTEISQRVAAQKDIEKETTLPFLSIDFGSMSLVNKINTAVKAHLSNMNGLPVLLQLGRSGKSDVWVTDAETTAQVNLSDIVKNKKFGYQAIKTNFKGDAFIIPVEQLRSVVESRFNLVTKMSYMDDGVFIANQVVDPKTIKTIVPFRGDRTEQRDLVGYYFDTYKESNFIPLNREDFKSLPYFRYNSYGNQEFENFEQMMINLLEKTQQDILAVLDTEGTGLGQAPKCFNIGGTNIQIKKDSGFNLSEDDFNQRLYRDEKGQAYLLTAEAVAKNEASATEKEPWRLFKGNASGGAMLEEEIFLSVSPESIPEDAGIVRLTNYVRKDGKVYCNREIDGFAFSYLIKDDDFAVTPELENLTGLSQDMIQRFGVLTEEADEQIAEYYSNLKNSDGEPAKIIFSAHNLPYDNGVIEANLKGLHALMHEHVLCDTAKISKSAKLAYDDTPVASFDNVVGVPPRVYFYDSPYSSYSLRTFFERARIGKGGVYPDATGRYVLSYDEKEEKLSFIDKKEINEILLDESPESMQKKCSVGEMPATAVKYSVEKLSTRAMIRNIMLHDYERPKLVRLEPEEESFRKQLEVFQDQYHFDNSLEDNIRFFQGSQAGKDSGVSDATLLSVGSRFLFLNADTQAKFHDGWIYEKVLCSYEPEANEGRVSKDIVDQIKYHTDLPRKKIEKIFQDTISFKKRFGLQRALVHEQHNNIRQHSIDGQGLSDTFIESVLPNLLAMMKYYNPYTSSSDNAVNAIINTNLRGAMQQLFVKTEHQDLAAIDSFSMRQLRSYDRDNKTDLVNLAQVWYAAGGWDDESNTAQTMRFKLPGGALPDKSGVYGIPKRALTEEEIADSAEKLNFILMNEQLRLTRIYSGKLSEGYVDCMSDIAESNDEKCIEYRDIILDRFEKVEFQRKEDAIGKISKKMAEAFQGQKPTFAAGLINEIRKNPELLVTAAALQVTHHNIEKRLGYPAFLSPETSEIVSDMLTDLTEIVESVDGGKKLDAEKGKAQKAAQARAAQSSAHEFSPVRTENFLPDLDIRRQEPLKFILDTAGPGFLGNFLEQQQDPDFDLDVEDSVSVSSSRSKMGM